MNCQRRRCTGADRFLRGRSGLGSDTLRERATTARSHVAAVVLAEAQDPGRREIQIFDVNLRRRFRNWDRTSDRWLWCD